MKKLLRRSMGAFTMAEILISLTIIGVIAAITLPSLRANINERTWATQKKALFARMSQAIALLDSANSYDSAQAFVTEGLNEVLKINNICAGDSLSDCGIATNFITMAGSASTLPKTWNALGLTSKTFTNPNSTTSYAADSTDLVAAFETQNGESIMVFYNPDCVPDNEDSPSTTPVDMFPYVCANMIYDLNQDKGPNTVGKDIGYMSIFYASDSVVATGIPASADSTTACPDTERLPNLNEAVAMELNAKLLPRTAANLTSGRGMALGTGENPTVTTWYYTVSAKGNAAINRTSSTTAPVMTTAHRCIKR